MECWAAGSYNIAFDTEIGHFQFCTGPVKIPATPFGLLANGNPTTCPTGDMEGCGASASAPDGDDLFCFPGSEAPVYKVLETDLPAIESTCNTATGAGCTLIPQTDLKQPAAFYPFYSITNTRHGCVWQFGNSIPGQITDFGRNAGYGSLLALSYTQMGGASANVINDFRNILPNNPCPAQ